LKRIALRAGDVSGSYRSAIANSTKRDKKQRLNRHVNSRNIFTELKRRNVYKVAVAYIVGGWALSQGIAQVFPVFDVPNWAIRLVVLLIIIGLPVALVLAWAFEITPQGIKRTETADAMPQAGRQKNNAWIYVVVVGAIVSIGLFFLGRYTAGNAISRNREPAAALPQKSIAVLPLLNESGDPKDEYFSDGLSEELIAALAQISGLKVIGRSSSFRFKDRKEEPKTIGQKLGVATLLDGTVRKQGDRVRIVAELVNAADGIQLWTRTFDRQLKDIFAVQEEIARAVAESLKVTLLGGDARSVQGSAPSNAEAHNAYLQGHFYLVRRNVEDFRKAIGYYDQAIKLDPEYALAYAERGEAWTILGDLTGQRPMAYPKARSDAEKAVSIAPALAEARAALGFVRCFVDWKFADGLSELKRAKELSPTNPTANDLLARIIVYVGRFDEAERQAREAVELDPLSTITQSNLARVLFYAGKLDEADAAARKAAELQPTGAANHRWQVLIAAQRGDGDAALREAQLEPDPGFRRFELAVAHYVRGDRAAADAALADLIANAREGFAYQIAEVYALRGEKDEAFKWLQIAFDDRDAGMLGLLVDPLLRGLRDDARYKNLLVKVGLPTTS
jgi:TolB-like protein/Tfp pilus assembly protein PilF